MRICYLASPGIHTNRWVKYFVDKGHEIHLITSKAREGSVDRTTLHVLRRLGPQTRIANYLLNSAPLFLQFKALLRKIKPDIIHSQPVMDITLLGAISGFHPFIVTPWGSDILIAPQESRVTRWIVNYVLKRADLITCDADHIKDPLIRLGAAPEKIKLIYFGVDTRKFKPGPRDEKLREELGIGNSPAIISLRRFEPIYNVESLIRAAPLVLQEVPQAKFLLVEKGSQEAELKQLAHSLGVAESVRFVGWVPGDELPRYLDSADIYVSTALSDAGLSASTAEAMACGLPVIVTDFGDNGKWVEDGVNGFLVPRKAPEVLASKIIHLLQHEDTRQKFGRANQQIIKERNNWEKEMERMDNLYAELAKQYKKSR